MASAKAKVDRRQVEIRELRPSDKEVVALFDCGDDDLNEFIRIDAFRLGELRVTRTYLGILDGELVGYVSLLADAVKLKSTERKRLTIGPKSFGHGDHPVVPALKVARLAVGTAAKSAYSGVGTALMAFAFDTAWTIAESVGCRLLTLDAYPQSEAFYAKLGFVRNKDGPSAERPSMRLDILAPEPSWVAG